MLKMVEEDWKGADTERVAEIAACPGSHYGLVSVVIGVWNPSPNGYGSSVRSETVTMTRFDAEQLAYALLALSR